MDIGEPVIERERILFLDDDDFGPQHVIIITGAAAGIGRACCVAAAANNLTVVGLDCNQEGGEETWRFIHDMGGRMEFVNTDLMDDDQINAAVDQAAGMGAVKYLLNVAGMQHIDFIEDFPMEVYDRMQRVMIRAPFMLSKLCIPHFKNTADQKGVVGNMASVHGHITTMAKASYNISKFALRGLTQSITAEGRGQIRAFTVSTGFVRTALAMGQVPGQAKARGISPEEVVTDVMCGHARVKELMDPIGVANLFIFGISKFSRHLAGGDLLFDGGMVLTYGD